MPSGAVAVPSTDVIVILKSLPACSAAEPVPGVPSIPPTRDPFILNVRGSPALVE